MEFVQFLSDIIWTRLVDKPAQRYPILVGIPLILLPIFIMAGVIYFLAHVY